jgi:mannosyltransferase
MISLVATALRLHALAAQSFWLDEGFSVAVARLPLSLFFQAVWRRELGMSLYFFLLHFWLLLGKSEGFIRGLSVVASVATVPVLYAVGARLFGRTTGLLAAWLLAINAFHVRFGQEARGYALVAFFATLATWLLIRNLQEPGAARWGLFAAAGALAAYSHFYGALVMVAHFLSLMFLRRTQIAWRKIVFGFGQFAVLMIPIAIFSARTATGLITWLPSVSLTELLSFGVAFSGNDGRILFALDVLMIGAAALAAARVQRAQHGGPERWNYFLVFLWLLAPLGIILAVSLVRPIFFPRYLSPCLPALVLLVAAGIARLRPMALGAAFGIAISACSLLGTFSYYQRDFDVAHENWRGASEYLFDRAQPGDTVFVFPPFARAPLEFYRWQRQSASTWPKSLNPSDDTRLPGEDLVTIPETNLQSVGVPGNRVWLVLLAVYNPTGKPDPAEFAVRDWLVAGRRRVDVHRLYPIDIDLFEKDAPSSSHAPSQAP